METKEEVTPVKPSPTKGQWIPFMIMAVCITLAFLQQAGYIDLRILNVDDAKNVFKTPVELTSLSTSSAVPAQLLTVYGKGFDRTSLLSVRFSNDNGYNITLIPAQVTDTGVIVAVPPYVDFENAAFASGTVNVQIISYAGNKILASNTANLEIKDLPKFTERPGTITIQFLDNAIAQIKETKIHAGMVKTATGGSLLDANTSAYLDRLTAGYTALKKEVQSVMADKSKNAQFAKIDNQTLYYNQETLATADRLFGSLMQAPASTNLITGAAVGTGVACQRLEGFDLSIMIACVQKYYSFADAAVSITEYADETYLKNPILGKGLKGLSFLSDVSFFAFTLPGMMDAYQRDLEAITARTGKEEYEIAEGLNNFYLGKLALKALGPAGTALGIMGDLIVGPDEVLVRRSFHGILADTFIQGLAYQVNLGPQESGLNKIRCDMCGKEQKDFAVMAGIKGKGRITSVPKGISCPGDCTEIYVRNVSVVKLSATPDEGYAFEGWSLACTGKGICMIPFGKDKAVIATFVKEPEEKYETPAEDNDKSKRKCPATSCDTGNCCGSNKNGVTTSGVITYGDCSCPKDTELAGVDRITAGGPYNMCTCI
jgi:hypothetical protein